MQQQDTTHGMQIYFSFSQIVTNEKCEIEKSEVFQSVFCLEKNGKIVVFCDFCAVLGFYNT